MSLQRILLLIVLSINTMSTLFGQVYLKDILFNGQEEKPHMKCYYVERFKRFTESDWLIGDENVDMKDFNNLLKNDFYAFYKNKIDGVDLSSDLRKKIFERTDEYKTLRDRMTNLRNMVLDDTIHVQLDGFKYSTMYDVNRGGFHPQLDFPENFPIIKAGYNRYPPYIQHYDPTRPAPFWTIISDEVLRNVEDKWENNIKFFMPIANEEVALCIEESCTNEHYSRNDDYQFLLRLKYVTTPDPALKIVDIILYRTSDRQIIWSVTTGDLSQKLNPEPKGSDVSDNQQQVNTSGQDRIYEIVEQPAEFPGGQSALMKFLSNNIRYPEQAQQKGVSGRVIVKCVIEKDGSITNPTILKGADPELDSEALRVVRSMPKWTPSKSNGSPVRSYYNLPISFRLQQQ